MASISKYYRKDSKGNKKQVGWRAQIIMPDGKRTQLYGKSREDVEAKLVALQNDLFQYGNVLSKDSYTVSEWIHKVLFSSIYYKVAASTFDRYVGIYNNYFSSSCIGDMDVKDIRQIDLQNFFNQNTHLAHATLKKMYFILNQAFNAACSNNIIRINPITGIIIPNKNIEPKEIEILSLEQQRNYIRALEDEPHGLLFLTTLFTGMRLGEVTALKWKHIDLDKGIISVAESIKRSRVYTANGDFESQNVTKKPKSKSGVRQIPLPEFLIDKLKHCKPATDDDQTAQKYVFCTSNGTHLLDSNIRKYHHRICSNAKINPIKHTSSSSSPKYKGVSFHALRHTFATRLIESGENIKTVSTLLGHKDIETTLNIYAHVLEDIKQQSATKQNDLFYALTV